MPGASEYLTSANSRSCATTIATTIESANLQALNQNPIAMDGFPASSTDASGEKLEQANNSSSSSSLQNQDVALKTSQDEQSIVFASWQFNHNVQQGGGNCRWKITFRELPVLLLGVKFVFVGLGTSSRGLISDIPSNQISPQLCRGNSSTNHNVIYLKGNGTLMTLSIARNSELTTVVLDTDEFRNIETEMLQYTSTYFSSIFRYPGVWQESTSGIVKLDGVDLSTLDVFRYWLETGSLENTDTLIPNSNSTIPAQDGFAHTGPRLRKVLMGNRSEVYLYPVRAAKLDNLIKCILFADYIGATAFHNDLMDTLFVEYEDMFYDNCAIPLYNIHFICENTPSHIPLWSFIVDSIFSCLSAETLKKTSTFGLLSTNLSIDVAVQGMRTGAHGRDVYPWTRTFGPCFCKYHTHPEGPLNSPCSDPFTWNVKDERGNTRPQWDTSYIISSDVQW